MTTPRDFTQDDLLAFADGRLDDATMAEIEAYLAEHPEVAAEVAEWQRQNETITALYGHVADEPVPSRLSPHLIASDHSSGRARWWQMAAAVVLVFGLGSGAGWTLRGAGTDTPDTTGLLLSAAVQAHDLFVVQRAHPVEVAASESQHLTTWLSNSLDRRLAMPDLEPAGLTLVGGRLLPSVAGSAAQVMYEDADGKRVTLYITSRRPDDAGDTRFTRSGDVAALYWATTAITCTIVGDLEQDEMQAIAGHVFSALSFGDDRYQRS